MAWNQEYWQRRIATSLAMAPSDAVAVRRTELQSQYGIVGEEADAILANENLQQNSCFTSAVASAVIECASKASINSLASEFLIDVSLGQGDLAWALIPIAKGLGLRYLGVDPSSVAQERVRSRLSALDMRDGFELMAAEAGTLLEVIPPCAARIVLWGRIGLHLTKNWVTAIGEVHRLLKPGGVFLLAETVTDLNEHLLSGSKKHDNTIIRSIWDYAGALSSMSIILCRSVPYWREQVAIVAWQKQMTA